MITNRAGFKMVRFETGSMNKEGENGDNTEQNPDMADGTTDVP